MFLCYEEEGIFYLKRTPQSFLSRGMALVALGEGIFLIVLVETKRRSDQSKVIAIGIMTSMPD